MSEMKTHRGSCHCGKVRFEATLALDKGMACNCSICSRVGSLLSFVPADRFQLLSGADALTDYQFGKKRLHHVFCSTCGVHPFAEGARPDGTKMFGINLRCLEDVDLSSVAVQHFDGKSL